MKKLIITSALPSKYEQNTNLRSTNPRITFVVRMFVLLLFVLRWNDSFSQNISINATGAPADPSAILDVSATNLGLLIPRLSTVQRNAIASPANSLLIFNTTTECFEAYHAASSTWVAFGCIGCQLPGAFSATAATGITPTAFAANWTASSGASSYFLDVSTVSNFATFVPGYNNLNVGNVTTYNVTSLTCATTYYYRVRASNSCGTSPNSNTITVTTSACPPTCGTQVFATANLNVGTQINSTASGQQQLNNGIDEKYCYNNVAANCTDYGGLYEWGEAMNYAASTNCDPCGSGGVQGICPAGYHIPTDLEWSRWEYCIENNIASTGTTSLATFQTTTGWRGTASNAGPGAKMKMSGGCDPGNSTCWNGTNASGFAALPAGYRYYAGGAFYDLGTNAYYWSATELSGTRAWNRHLNSTESRSSRNDRNKAVGFSVRCLQD